MSDLLNNGQHKNAHARVLIYIPIIHTMTDMGVLKESVHQTILKKFGIRSLKRKMHVTNELWSQIEQVIHNLALNYETVRLYQDGLPVCGMETQIVSDLARQGSRNHQLLLRLIEKGAILMGAESSDLLIQEYNLTKQMITKGNAPTAAKGVSRPNALSDTLLKRRDQFMADRINTTLCIGETGIVFLGMLHDLTNHLSPDIHVTYPLSMPVGSGKR